MPLSIPDRPRSPGRRRGRAAAALLLASLVGCATPGYFARVHAVVEAPRGARALLSGTGVAIGSGGLVLTAAHVVRDCRAVGVLAPGVHGGRAVVLGRDPGPDLALLRADAAASLPVVALSERAAEAGPLALLGYPASGGVVAPTLAAARELDVGAGFDGLAGAVWLQGGAVTNGFSGGPVVEIATGRLVGIERGEMAAGDVAARLGRPIGPIQVAEGRMAVESFLHGLGIGEAGTAPSSLAAVRAATLHVICWR